MTGGGPHGQELQRHLLAEQGVLGLVHVTGRPRAEHALDLEAPRPRARLCGDQADRRCGRRGVDRVERADLFQRGRQRGIELPQPGGRLRGRHREPERAQRPDERAPRRQAKRRLAPGALEAACGVLRAPEPPQQAPERQLRRRALAF